ncbi:MAG: AI-2E family transporter [Mariprofundaceae bacterium]|nr:AI-2E family transporter [Mariprofundaceae bacterium]
MTLSSGSEKLLISGACLVVLIAGMQAAAPLLVPFLMAAFIASVCLPPMQWLMERRVPATAAVFTVISGVVLIGLLITAFAGASVADFSQNLPLYQARLEEQMTQFIAWLFNHGIAFPDTALHDLFNLSAAMGMAGAFLSGIGNALANTFFIVLTVIFILFEAVALPHKWAFLGEHAPSTDALKQFMQSVNRYLVIKTGMSIATGAAVTVWLTILGVDYPILWGIVAFLFNFVPNIGSIIAAVPALLLALVQLGPDAVLYTGTGYIVINLLIGNVVEPRFMGRGVGLSTLVVFISLVFWGWVLGLVGMLLSVPLTMIVKIALESNSGTRWIAVLLGPDVQPEEEKPEA